MKNFWPIYLGAIYIGTSAFAAWAVIQGEWPRAAVFILFLILMEVQELNSKIKIKMK